MRFSASVVLGVLLSVLYAVPGFGGTAGDVIDTTQIDGKLAAIAAYKQGDPTEPLIAVEQLIRRSQSRAESRKYIERGLARLLESNVSADCKLFICTQLSFIGTQESVPAIAKLLTDEQTVDMACYAIGHNPSAEAGKALRDALDKATPSVQVRIIDLLGDRRDADSGEILGKLVFAGEKEVAVAATAALGKFGGANAIELLARARAAGDDDLRSAATDAYLRCAENLATEGKTKEALAIYRELAGEGEAAFTRSAAINGLADIGGADVVALVAAALKDTNRIVKTTAQGCVRTMQGPGVTELFVAELPKSSPAEQVLLIAALADRGDPAAIGAITTAAKSTHAEVAKAALAAIGKIGGPSEVEFLVIAAAEAATVEEGQSAVQSLTVLRGDGVDDAIVKNMRKSQDDARAKLIEVLLERNAVTAVAPLLAEARSTDSKVRTAAFKALARLGRPKDLPLLISLLVDMQGGTGRKDAERATLAVARKIAEPAKQADAVIAALGAEKRIEARCSLLHVLGGIADDKSLQAVRAALKDDDVQVRDAAVRTLAGWPDARVADELLGIYRDAKNQVHRLLSLRGLVRTLAVHPRQRPADRSVAIYRQAVQLAGSAQEKKLVLSGLANVAHPQALEMATAAIDDEAGGAEAALAAVKIARVIAGNCRSEAKAAARKVLSATANEAVRHRARDVIEMIESFGDYITAWQVSGPYMQQDRNYQELFDIVFAPETGDDRQTSWHLMPAGTDVNQPWVMDLLQLFQAEQQAAYLRTTIYCPGPQQGRLEIGSDDGVKVWLNGTVVHANNVTRSISPGSDNIDVVLARGANRLLVKVTQNDLQWAFCARLRKTDGAAIEDIRIDCFGK